MLRKIFTKVNIRATVITGVIAAILFCIPVFFYVHFAEYRQTWRLYLGSFLFFGTIWIHTMIDSKKRDENESTVALIFSSHMATLAGIILSCIICLLLLIVMVHGFLGPGEPAKVLTGEPANTISGRMDGLSFDILMAATFINFSVGSFASIVLPFYLKRNQTKDQREPTPFHNRERV
jgi:hypothetical protein